MQLSAARASLWGGLEAGSSWGAQRRRGGQGGGTEKAKAISFSDDLSAPTLVVQVDDHQPRFTKK